MEYLEFLRKKSIQVNTSGFDIDKADLNPMLFEFQRDIVRWALKKGKAAIFADCGLGKTPMQIEFGRQVHKRTGGNVLIIAPLAVSQQTGREGKKFGIDVNICRKQQDVKQGINITNYEMIDHFDIDTFACVVLDESSILKGFDRHYSQTLIEKCANVPYKLSCTATPCPNDYMELGTQCEWLGVMSRMEMLATFFIHEGSDTAKWRLKGHAEDMFWEWVASWAVALQKPSDIGYDDDGFILPKLHMHEVIVESPKNPYCLFVDVARTMNERRQARKDSLENRVKKAAEFVNGSNEQWLVWCDLNAESELLKKAIPDAVEVSGSDKTEHKEKAAIDFATGSIRVIVSKPSIFGWGINWQNCSNMVFVGLSDSYEQLRQAIRRCWRFGQTKEVHCYIVISESEGAVKANIERKEADTERMIAEMVKHAQKILTEEIHGTSREKEEYNPQVEMILPDWLEVST